VSAVKNQVFSPELTSILRGACGQARQLGHSYVGTEHLVLSMLHESGLPASRVLGWLGWREGSFRSLLLADRGRGAGRLPLVQGLSPRAEKVVAGACEEARRLRAPAVRPEHLLLAIAREERCTAACMLQSAGADLDCVFSDA